MTPRLSIVVPTLGRTTLHRTLMSILPQLDEPDEVVVVADLLGDPDAARAVVDGLGHPRARFAECHYTAPGVGNAQRRLGIELAYGTHLLFMDDDDVYVPGALELMRAAACERPVIFRMDATAIDDLPALVWSERDLRLGNVGTPMFIVPSRRDRLGQWEPYRGLDRGSDFVFIHGCCKRQGEPIWREELVAVVRPGAAEPAGIVDARGPSSLSEAC